MKTTSSTRLRTSLAVPVRRLAIACIVAAGLAAPAAAAGIACDKAQTAADRMICKDSALRALDGRIARRYARLLAAFDGPTAAALRRDQRWFVSARDQAALTMGGRVNRADLAESLGHRLRFLDAVLIRPPAGLAGKWQNVAGSVTLTPRPGNRIAFDGGAADPQSARWVCEAAGIGTITAGGASIPITDAPNPAWTIVAVRRGAALDIDERSPGNRPASPPYCGFNGTLAGRYFRVAN